MLRSSFVRNNTLQIDLAIPCLEVSMFKNSHFVVTYQMSASCATVIDIAALVVKVQQEIIFLIILLYSHRPAANRIIFHNI